LLKFGLMTLHEYFNSLTKEQREAFAKRCETSVDYLIQLSLGYRQPKVELAVRISKESGGQVTCEGLLPDVDWKYLRKQPRAA
jgi:DNA-binding transcriptional regulator YdaS (Cro superfamily)